MFLPMNDHIKSYMQSVSVFILHAGTDIYIVLVRVQLLSDCCSCSYHHLSFVTVKALRGSKSFLFAPVRLLLVDLSTGPP